MTLPTLLLTRPETQACHVLHAVEAQIGRDVAAVIAPVLRIERRDVAVDLAGFAGVIVTSVHGVGACDLNGRTVHHVGRRTGEALRQVGAVPGVFGVDADALIAQILAGRVPGPLLHLRGEHARGGIAERLNSAGIETHEVIVYAQEAIPLSADAAALIEGDGAVVLPLYSPRSARLVGQAVGKVGPRVRVLALSAAVADAFATETGHTPDICATPSGDEMVSRIVADLTSDFA